MVIDSLSREWSGIVSGVPQGSVLGQINLYINDKEVRIKSSISVYPNNTKLSREILSQ